jgi:hypothetical protein
VFFVAESKEIHFSLRGRLEGHSHARSRADETWSRKIFVTTRVLPFSNRFAQENQVAQQKFIRDQVFPPALGSIRGKYGNGAK